MNSLHLRQLFHALLLAVVLTLGTGSLLSAAYAAEEQKTEISQEQLDKLAKASAEDREKVRTTAVDKYTQEFCSQILDQAIAFPGQDKNKICSDEIGKNVNAMVDTPEKGLKGELDLQQVCGAAGSNVSNLGLKKACMVDALQQKLSNALTTVTVGLITNPAVSSIISTGQAVAEVAEFIKDPKDPFEMLANHVHKEAVNITTKVMESATKSTDFDPTQAWFTSSWAGGAGVGILLMGFMLILTLKDLGAGKIDEDEVRSSMLRWGPTAVIIATFGPALMGQLTNVMSAMNSGIINARGSNLAGRILDFINELASVDSMTTGLGPIVMIIVFIVMIIASLMLFIVFLVQQFALIMLAYGIAIMIGALINPRWRSGIMKAATTWLTVLFSKPILLIMMSLIFTIDFASIAPDNGLKLLSQIVLVILAIGAVAFSPMILLKYVPMVSSPGALSTPSGPQVDSYTSGGTGGGTSDTSHMNSMVSRANEKSNTTVENQSSDSATGSTSGTAGSSGQQPTSSSAAPASNAGVSSDTPPTESTADTGASSSSTPAQDSSDNASDASTADTTPSVTGKGSAGGAGSGASSTGSATDTSTDSGEIDAGDDYVSVKPVEGGVHAPGTPVDGSSASSSAGTSSSAGAGLGASGSASSGVGATSASGASGATAGTGAVAGGAFAGVLAAAAAAKKTADTGKDALVGLNEEAANFQDYNSDQQPSGR